MGRCFEATGDVNDEEEDVADEDEDEDEDASEFEYTRGSTTFVICSLSSINRIASWKSSVSKKAGLRGP